MARPKKAEEVQVNEEEILEAPKAEEISNEEVVTSTGDIETEEPAVEAPKAEELELKKLICKQPFTDKFDNSINYVSGDVLNITDVNRRNDLISRGLAAEE